ncbi:MAG: protein kinase [Planctomycetota bacterium]|nr:protein kinase [Planctomycetota bacterium]
MSPRNEDFLFAQEAQNKGYVTEDQVEEAFLLQKRMAEELKIDERLAVILVKRGWMAEDQARRVYALLEPEGKRVQIEGYKLVERVGRGSMGTVYKAIHLGLHRVVAVKVLRRELLGEKVHTERLKNEARMLAELEHPHIVRALDAGESNGFPYVVMEYVEGETLKDRIARLGALEEDEALRIGRGIADALEKARRMGVVHRDVKPGNILISSRGVAKLMDLGLAKGPVDMELTQHGATVGTPQFMAPEQVEEAGAVDCRSDIYGLGATMYAMLTGRPPFTGASMAEILNKVLNEQPIPIRAVSKHVSPEVSYLVERMMLKDPSLRYQVPVDVVEHMDRVLGGQSIIPDGFQGNWEGYLLKARLAKRRRRLRIAAVALLAIAIGGYVGFDYTQRMAARDRAEATIDQILTEGADNEFMTRNDLERKLGRLTELKQKLREQREAGGLSDRTDEADRRIERLERYEKRWKNYDVLLVEVDRLVKQRRFGTAHTQLLAFRDTCTDYPALRRQAGSRITEVLRASALAVDQVVAQAKDIAAGNVGEYAARFRALSDQLARGDFVERPRAPGGSSPLERARRALKTLSGQLETVRGAVDDLRGTYAGKAVNEAIRSATPVVVMRRQLETDVARVKLVLETSLRAETWTGGFRREPIFQLVENQLESVARDFDDQVNVWGEEILRGANRLVKAEDYGPALEAVNGLLKSLGGKGFEGLRARGTALATEIEVREAEMDARRLGLLQETAQRVAERLKRGEVARARRAIDQALAEKAAEDQEVRTALGSLEHGLEAVEAVWAASLDALAAAGENARFDEPLRVYDDAWQLTNEPFEKWRLGRVDKGLRRITARVFVGDRYVERTFDVRRFPFGQHLTWAEMGGKTVDPMHAALVRLFDVTESSWLRVPDLRPVRTALQQVLAELERIPGLETWQQFVDGAEEAVGEEQDDRETESANLRRTANRWKNEGDYVPALDKYREYLAPGAPWRATDDFDKWADAVRAAVLECEAEAAKREIETWLKGFRAEELANGRTRLRCGFDIPVCLDSFLHGYGRLVSEEGSVVTPGGATADRYALELLSGVEGLLPSRPLSLPCMFDAADTIEMAFDLDTRQGAFFLALDIDGAQIGILSADPRWFPGWTLPDAVLAEDEDAVDFYGRGRGIAWRDGLGFGEVARTQPKPSKWNWQGAQRGRNHAGWTKLEEGKGRQFAFKPGHRYRVKLVRARDRLTLMVADLRSFRALGEKAFEEVWTRRESVWRSTGTDSEVAPGELRRGSGKLSILSWSTVRIDNLELTGLVREAWKTERRKAENEAKKDAEKAK